MALRVDGRSDLESDGKNSKDHAFYFRDCRFTVPVKGKDKDILKGVTGEARAGEVLAIMGPSGAGKTQLMNLLALVAGPGYVSGEVLLNGHRFNRKMFVKYCGMVPQMDFHWSCLTCRENVEYAAVRTRA